MWWGPLASSWLVILARDPAGIKKLRCGGGLPEDFKLPGRHRTPPNSDFLVLVGSSRRTGSCPEGIGPYQILIFSFWWGPAGGLEVTREGIGPYQILISLFWWGPAGGLEVTRKA